MIELPNKKKCYNLPEQVAQNLLNIQYLAEQYANIDALPAIWQTYKEEFDSELDTFEGWERTFGGWETTLETYLASMSSAAVGAIAGQDIAPGAISATGPITGPSIIENMAGYLFETFDYTNLTKEIVYAGVVKNGNKITFVIFAKLTRTGDIPSNVFGLGRFTIPASVYNKLYPYSLGWRSNVLDTKVIPLFYSLEDYVDVPFIFTKETSSRIQIVSGSGNLLPLNQEVLARTEITFLLSDNLAS